MSKEISLDENSSRLRPYFVACVVSLIQLLFGMCVGWMSPATIGLQANPPAVGGQQPFSTEEINWLGSLTLIGCLIGLPIWGVVTEKIGRKPTCCLLALPVIVGWSLILVADSLPWMYWGRFILGLSGTGAIVPVQLYLNEISEDSYRGTLTSIMVLFFNGGIALSYILGSILSLRRFTQVCSLLPFIYLFAFYLFPESPVYLFRRNRKKEAEISLLWYRNNNYVKVQKELTRMGEIMKCGLEKSGKVQFSSIFKGKARAWAMIINLWLFLVQQFCGIIIMLTYTSLIIGSSGSNLIDPDNGAVVVGVLQLIVCWITTMILEKTCRKPLLMFSLFGMFISQVFLGWFYSGISFEYLPNWVPLASICLHVASYCFGVGPLPFVISAEITHPEIQPTALSLLNFWATGLSFVSLKIYPYLIHFVGEQGSFWFYATWCLIAMISIPKLLPETRGKSFEQIIRSLERGKSAAKDEFYQELNTKCNIEMKKFEEKV